MNKITGQATSFENLLLEKGYIQHAYNHKTRQLEPKNVTYYSTMSAISTVYIKGQQRISFGIRNYDFPAMLETPIKVRLKYTHGTLDTFSTPETTQKLFNRYTDEQILTAIESNESLELEVNEE